MRLLLVEDDLQAARLLAEQLAANGHQVVHAENGEAGLALAIADYFDVMLVDCMMPKLDGLDMLRQLRDKGCATPALVLSALGEVDDRVEGLQAGGDDYLVKPYALAELEARLQALVRRAQVATEFALNLSLADLHVNLGTRQVTRNNKNIILQPREYNLLVFLLRHKNQLVTRSMLLQNVWQYSIDTQTNVIDVHISRLRNKLDKGFTPRLIHTIHGQGFCLKVENDTK